MNDEQMQVFRNDLMKKIVVSCTPMEACDIATSLLVGVVFCGGGGEQTLESMFAAARTQLHDLKRKKAAE